VEEFFEIVYVPWVAVGQRPPEVIPDQFVGVEFGRVPREGVGVQTGTLFQKLLDARCLMGVGAVPQEDHVVAQVFEQLPEEGHHLPGADVLVRMESCVEGDALVLRGQGDGGDGRDLTPVLGTAKKGRPASWRPSPAHAGNQQEPALIQKGQMGPKPFGVFLYAASDTASRTQWLVRPVPGPASPAFGSSTPSRSVAAIRGSGGSGHALDPRSGERFALESRGRSCSQRPEGSAITTPLTFSSAIRSAGEGVRESAWGATPSCPGAGRPDTTETQNSWPLPASGRQQKDSCPFSEAAALAGAALPIVEEFLGVSCPQGYSNSSDCSILYAKVNKAYRKAAWRAPIPGFRY